MTPPDGAPLPSRRAYLLYDVFTDTAFGGNQLAVFPQADGLTTEAMQMVARELNLSESVFLQRRGQTRSWDVRIFTPAVENPFAGHPTVGAALALVDSLPDLRTGASVGLVLHEQVGPIEVQVAVRDGRAQTAEFVVPGAPVWGEATVSAGQLAEVLGLEEEDICDGGWSPRPVSCGIPYYIVPLRSLEAIRRATLNMGAWERHLAADWAPHLYIFSTQTERPGSSYHARMFPPAMGVAEDPATGSAAAALGPFVARAERADGPQSWIVEQGFELGRPSLIRLKVAANQGEAEEVRIAGSGVFMGGGELATPQALREFALSISRR